MRGYQHLALGTITGLCLASAMPNDAAGLAICASCMAGSLYPDIDLSASKIGSRVKPASTVIHALFGHRGFIHTPVNAVLMSALLYTVSKCIVPELAMYITEGFAIGFFLHLLQDTFTRSGIMWLWPLKFRIHFTRITSGSILCIPITAALAALSAGLILYVLPAAQVPMLIGP